MLVISNSTGKSASSVFMWYTHELLGAAYGNTGQKKLKELTRTCQLSGSGQFVYPLDEQVLDTLIDLSQNTGPTVVKTHHDLTPVLRSLLENNQVKATFCHRDPRDMILSAMDHYKRSSKEGDPQFKKFSSIPSAIKASRWWCEMACDWVESGLACVFKYNDIVTDPKNELLRLCDYLGLLLNDSVIDNILEKERKTRLRGARQFNKGSLLRFPGEMNKSDQKKCEQELADYISRLGYAL